MGTRVRRAGVRRAVGDVVTALAAVCSAPVVTSTGGGTGGHWAGDLTAQPCCWTVHRADSVTADTGIIPCISSAACGVGTAQCPCAGWLRRRRNRYALVGENTSISSTCRTGAVSSIVGEGCGVSYDGARVVIGSDASNGMSRLDIGRQVLVTAEILGSVETGISNGGSGSLIRVTSRRRTASVRAETVP